MSKIEISAGEVRSVIEQCDVAVAAADEVMRVGRGGSAAIMMLTIAGLRAGARAAANLMDGIAVGLEDEPEPTEAKSPARAPRASGEHRHKFGPDNVCVVAGCGKVKSPNGRKPAGEVAPPVDTRTRPLPLGDAAADRFTDGGQGSSGVVRR